MLLALVILATNAHAADSLESVKLIPGESLNMAQRAKNTSEYVKVAEQRVKEVLVLLEFARKNRQAVRIACLIDTLTEMQPHATEIRRLSGVIQQPGLGSEENLQVYHAVLGRMAATIALAVQARSCVGELAAYADGETVFGVETRAPPNFDPNDMAEPISIEGRPPPASPYQLRQR